jgi:choice-of-anchor B domain-containing protein
MKKYILVLIAVVTSFYAKGQSLSLVGHLSYNVSCAGVWHYVDSLNNEYALVGANNRVSIVDVTNPSSPTEVFSVPALSGQNSLWREIKTYNKFAYAVSEGGGGVIVIDLSLLPASISYNHWYGDSAINGQLQSAHTIAANDGYLYIFGSNIGSGGCIIADISDPANPHFTGEYSDNYIHDGYIRNDTLWAGEIYSGQFSVINVADKYNPFLLTTQQTPGQFCHNVWLSDNSNYAFTTDEITGTPLGSFDVSNIANIELKTIYFTDSIPGEEVHNVRVLNDYLINPSYGSQLTIVDAARPDNLIEIAHAPTDFGSGQPYLCWDASPYLPSGNIIATDIGGGLFVFQPDYQRACYLEGTTTDSTTGLLLNNVTVEILSTPKNTISDLSGIYKTGISTSGTYDVQFSKTGYVTKVYSGVSLANGVLTILNAELVPFTVNGIVTETGSGNGIGNIQVEASNGITTFSTTTDVNGNFTFTNITSGGFEVTAAGWGYLTQCINTVLDGTTIVSFQLDKGYSDDFTTNNNWTVNSTCASGAWVRGVPVGTVLGAAQVNPGADVVSDCSNKCYVTGNGGGNANTDDIDDGGTVVISPVFDLSTYVNPYINYSRWYFNSASTPVNNIDTLFITLNNGVTSVIIDAATLNNTTNGAWVDVSLRIANYIIPTATMTVSVYANDKQFTGNISEAGFDNFFINEGTVGIASNDNTKELQIFPNPFNDSFIIKLHPDFITAATTLQISDAAGRVVYDNPINTSENRISLATDLDPGFYVAKIYRATKAINPAVLIKN